MRFAFILTFPPILIACPDAEDRPRFRPTANSTIVLCVRQAMRRRPATRKAECRKSSGAGSEQSLPQANRGEFHLVPDRGAKVRRLFSGARDGCETLLREPRERRGALAGARAPLPDSELALRSCDEPYRAGRPALAIRRREFRRQSFLVLQAAFRRSPGARALCWESN